MKIFLALFFGFVMADLELYGRVMGKIARLEAEVERLQRAQDRQGRCWKTCSGHLVGSTNWIQYPDGKNVYGEVSIAHCGFIETPAIASSLGGNSNHWRFIGTSSVYMASTEKFRLYIDVQGDAKYASGITTSNMQEDYHINYVAHGKVC